MLAGCYLHHERPGEAEDAVMEQPVCTETVVKELSEVPLDLLFVVDNSASMHQEQAALRREFPRLVEVLTTGDRDGV